MYTGEGILSFQNLCLILLQKDHAMKYVQINAFKRVHSIGDFHLLSYSHFKYDNPLYLTNPVLRWIGSNTMFVLQTFMGKREVKLRATAASQEGLVTTEKSLTTKPRSIDQSKAKDVTSDSSRGDSHWQAVSGNLSVGREQGHRQQQIKATVP